MTNTPDQPSRLDQIESILLQTVATLDRVSEQQEINTRAIASLEDTVRENSAAIAHNSTAIAELRQELGDSISHLVGVIGDFAEEAQQDRVIFQAEIRRIWEYLLGQQPNGRGE